MRPKQRAVAYTGGINSSLHVDVVGDVKAIPVLQVPCEGQGRRADRPLSVSNKTADSMEQAIHSSIFSGYTLLVRQLLLVGTSCNRILRAAQNT
jgi:hypothetical protein